jgi:ubiquinone/menaquinone biosynthesis C-methylase UbiE
MAVKGTRDYTPITEMPGGLVTAEQRARLCQRYALARSHAAGRRVLEVACGAGLGLGYVAEAADWLAGGDYTSAVLDVAQAHYCGAVPLARFDAQRLPFRDAAFDLIVCFEAIYYFPRPELFLADCQRVLAQDGLLLVGSENRAWPHFAPGPLSARYYAVPELGALLSGAGFDLVEFFGSFEAEAYSPTQRVRAHLRRAITATGVFQRWPQARELLKPLVYRHAHPLGYEPCQSQQHLPPLVPLAPNAPSGQFKVIYARASSNTAQTRNRKR